MLMFEIFTVTNNNDYDLIFYRILQIDNVSTENKIIEKYFTVCILEFTLNDINIDIIYIRVLYNIGGIGTSYI